MSVVSPSPTIAVPMRPSRASVEIDGDALNIVCEDGRWQRFDLGGVEVRTGDASLARRFVRHAALVTPAERVDLVTPPADGAIAPRAAALPDAPVDALIVSGTVWETVVGWLQTGGRMSGRTVADLARLACIATSQFAIAIGEWAAQVALEMTWERVGPMRGGGDLLNILRPLEQAARHSTRASEAFVAALAYGSVS